MGVARTFADAEIEAKQMWLTDAGGLLGDAQLPGNAVELALAHATGQGPDAS